MTEPVAPTGNQDEPPVTGWKAIAARLDVSERTAQRWAERYGLPVHRHSRGGRPLVFAYAAQLDAWHQSEEAARAKGDAADPEDRASSGGTPGSVAAAGGTSDVVGGVAALAAVANPLTPRLRRWRTIVLYVMSAAALVACGAFVWLGAGSSAGRGLSEREAGRARGEALSHERVRLDVRVEGRSPSTVTIRPGEMVRIEVPGLRLGIQARAEGTRLRMIAHRLESLPQGESARYLLTRDLVNGQRERLVVEGVAVDLTWLGSSRSPDAGESTEPVKPCCVACEGVTVCGEAVGSLCGRCAGQAAAPVAR